MLYGIITILITVFLPCVILFTLITKSQGGGKIFVMGGLAYFISVGLLQSALINIITAKVAFFASSQLGYNILVAVLSAILLAAGSLVCYRFLLADAEGYNVGLFFGLGIGCTEALLLVGLNTLLQLANPAFLSSVGVLLLAAGVERISATMVHVAASIALLFGTRKHKPNHILLGFAVAIGFNLLGVLLVQLEVSPILIEALLFVAAMFCYAFSYKYKAAA